VIGHHRRGRPAENATERQGGAVMVEAVIVLPVLVMLVFGIISFGQAYSSGNTVAGATRTGARLASATYAPATDKNAAAAAVAAAVKADLSNLSLATPVEMWMYKADSNGLPNGDATFTNCSSNCIKWTWNTTTATWNSASGSWSNPNGCGQTLDYVGIYVKATHKLNNTFFGSTTLTIKQKTSMRIEPVSNVLC